MFIFLAYRKIKLLEILVQDSHCYLLPVDNAKFSIDVSLNLLKEDLEDVKRKYSVRHYYISLSFVPACIIIKHEEEIRKRTLKKEIDEIDAAESWGSFVLF